MNRATRTMTSTLFCRHVLATVVAIFSVAWRSTCVTAADPVSPETNVRTVYFGTDVVPILTKLGCNGGGCHGKATGQNGFRLSLFGFEPSTLQSPLRSYPRCWIAYSGRSCFLGARLVP